jgi:hypothetical protein
VTRKFPVCSVDLPSWRLPRHGCEILDARATALEDRLHGQLYGERCGAVDGFLFGYVDEKERAAGYPGVAGASPKAAPILLVGGLAQG